MKPLKVVFFGTPEFAATCLDAITQSPHQVVGVVTVADKASGRGQKISKSHVKKVATEKGIPVYQPEKLKNKDFLESMRSLEADVFVVVAFRMMPKVLFQLPHLGTFNLHASLLPDYRGAAPINYAIMNGEEKTGVTTFFINEKIDEGHILLQQETPISDDEDAGSLHDRLMNMGAELIVKTLDGLATDSIKEYPQPKVEIPKNAFKIFKEDTRIHWNQNSKKIYNFIRGLSPYPAAFTVLKIGDANKNLKIFAGTYDISKHSHAPGSIFISKTEFKIYTSDGYYQPTSLQLEGKKRMGLKDFLNGFRSYDDISIS